MSEITIELHSGMAPEEWDRAMAKLEEVGFAIAEKKGKWIDYCGGVKCDQCGFECDDTYYLGEANFCPNCGARMEESDGCTD